MKLPKNVLTNIADFRNWNKHTWCISLLVMTTIVVLTGLNQWMLMMMMMTMKINKYFEDKNIFFSKKI